MHLSVVAVATTLAAGALAALQAPSPPPATPAMTSLSPTPQPSEWISLLDDKATGWRGFRQSSLPAGWRVVDGALTRVGLGGDIVYGARAFGDFELELVWKLQPKGNSGIFYRVSEDVKRMFEGAPEFQVLDNLLHPDNKTDFTVAGANYALHAAPRDAVKPVGEWNQVRIVARGAHVEHWLNGRKVVEYELWSSDWEARVKKSKFVEWPTYGRAKSGFIGLQDHGDWVAYRNMRARDLR